MALHRSATSLLATFEFPPSLSPRPGLGWAGAGLGWGRPHAAPRQPGVETQAASVCGMRTLGGDKNEQKTLTAVAIHKKTFLTNKCKK